MEGQTRKSTRPANGAGSAPSLVAYGEPPALHIDRAIFSFVTRSAPDLLPVCRWLRFGPHLSAVTLREVTRQPTFAELTRLLRLFEAEKPLLTHFVCQLVEASPLAEPAWHEILVDRLLECREEWQHPSEILGPPRPDYSKLYGTCVRRRRDVERQARPLLDEITAKVARAARISTAAKVKRQRRRRRGRG